MEKIWEGVPQNLDILVTHGPPFGVLDKSVFNPNAGSKTILEFVERAQIPLHIFGHIHEAKGDIQIGNTHFYNVAEKMTWIELQIDH